MTSHPESSEIAVIDEQGHTVGMLISSSQTFEPLSQDSQESALNLRYPIPCSKQSTITTSWLKSNFEENSLTSVPRSIMFEEYATYCHSVGIQPFNQAVFGKVVRACFPNLATRRLGVRGQSRYHYAGLGVKISSLYSDKLRCCAERLNITRTNNCGHHRRRNVTTYSTIENASKITGKSSQAAFHHNEACSKSKGQSGSKSLVIPSYPSEDDVYIRGDWTKLQIASFMEFYRSYNRRLLGYIISLDFEKTSSHLHNFKNFVSGDCKVMLQSSSTCDVISVCDDIMFQEATSALLPNCLATLTSEFNVTVRKFAKTLPMWIGDRSNQSPFICSEITEIRKESAKRWSDHVRRVTTLCHVAKEARKTLTYPAIVAQLLTDLRNIWISDIANQCTFAVSGCYDENDKLINVNERDQAIQYVNDFCKLLQQRASIEEYADELEKIVSKHAGLKPVLSEKEAEKDIYDYNVITEETQRFMMKWAMYTSKILNEITLKSSESVGTFHLVMLLFGDYVNHLILLRNEQAKRISRLRSVIKEGSTYFKWLCGSSSNKDVSSEMLKSSIQSTSQEPFPLSLVTPDKRVQLPENDQTIHHLDVKPSTSQQLLLGKGGSDYEATFGKSVSQYSLANNQLTGTTSAFSNNENTGPAVVVEPAFIDSVRNSYYLIPSQTMQSHDVKLIKK